MLSLYFCFVLLTILGKHGNSGMYIFGKKSVSRVLIVKWHSHHRLLLDTMILFVVARYNKANAMSDCLESAEYHVNHDKHSITQAYI